jgi:hypothetical protein
VAEESSSEKIARLERQIEDLKTENGATCSGSGDGVDLGLPYGKTARVLKQAFGLSISRGGLCKAFCRASYKPVASRCAPSLLSCMTWSVLLSPDLKKP